MTKRTNIRTPDQVRAELKRRGLTITEWAQRNGVCPQSARDVLLGRAKGRSGEAHRVAVLMGLKEGVIEANAHDH